MIVNNTHNNREKGEGIRIIHMLEQDIGIKYSNNHKYTNIRLSNSNTCKMNNNKTLTLTITITPTITTYKHTTCLVE